MAGILVIESDRKRRLLLRTLLHEHARVEINVVDSVDAAIAGFEKYQPDLIVAPTLLPPEESDRLCSHVKQHADPHVQMFTLPALDMLQDAPAAERDGFAFFKRRRPAGPGLQYDAASVARQIAESVDRARQVREQRVADRDLYGVPTAGATIALHPVPPAGEAAADGSGSERRIDERLPQRSPWLWTVRLPGGGDVELVNISRSGILLESRSRVSPGVTMELHVSSPGVNRVAPARFVRSEVARVDPFGVRYHSAARFEQPFEMPSIQTGRLQRPTPQTLAELFSNVVTESNQRESRSTRFARGLRGLVGARDVRIGATPLSPTDDSESIYFTVKADGASRTILQVMFDRHRALTSSDFALLKAAVAMTTAVLELEPTCEQELRPAEVA